MAHRVCPWWLGYLLASPLRRLLQDPAAIVGPYVREGMTVLEPGPGMGFFTLAMAVVHEMPSAARLFAEASAAMKPGATLLFAEPSGHVKAERFAENSKPPLTQASRLPSGRR